jgi:predicted GTPase
MEVQDDLKDTLEHGLNDVLTRNIPTLLDKRRSEEKKANVEQRAVEAKSIVQRSRRSQRGEPVWWARGFRWTAWLSGGESAR